MKTFYFGDGLSEYKLEYTISIVGRVYLISSIRLRGIERGLDEIRLILFEHLKELGIEYTTGDPIRLKGYI